MPRQRFIHPDIWGDKKIAKLTFIERLFFIGCFSNADDEGRMIGDPAYLRSMIFKYDDLTLEQIKEIRDRVLLVNKNLILYQVDGEEYLFFAKWKEYQKPKYPTPSKIPPPPTNITEDSGNLPGELPEPLHHGMDLGRDGMGLGGVDVGKGETPPPKKEIEPNKLKPVIKCFENNIHPLSPIELEKLNDWAKDFDPPVIVRAIEEAVKNNARKLSYIQAVLRDWLIRKLTTTTALDAYMRDQEDKKRSGIQKKIAPEAEPKKTATKKDINDEFYEHMRKAKEQEKQNE
jgi:DnaD/phage-associated family protein